MSIFSPISYPAGATPVAQVIGDVNGDGRADLVVANQVSNTVSVLLGKGDGSLQVKTDFAVGATPVAVAIGDFNGDGKLDIATANFATNSVSVLLGNGDGTFKPKTDVALSATPVSLMTGDFNGDGKLDLVVATEDLSNDYATILRGNGDGSFQVPISTITDSAPKGIALNLEPFSTLGTADFNGDGALDVVVVNNKDFRTARSGQIISAGSVSVMLGNGDGTLQAPRITAVGASPRTVAVGDFNGDGRPDFAVGNYVSGNLSVFMNTGGGSFSSASVAPGGSPFSLVAGDFNGDGHTDLAVSLATIGTGVDLNVLFGQSGGSLQSAAMYVAPDFISLSAGDFNGDGHTDLAGAVSGPSNTASVLANNGNGTFPAPFLIASQGVTLSSQATADFNGDGIPDRVTAASGQVELGLGDGFFGDPTPILGGGSVAAADVDGNGTPDVLVSGPGFPAGQVALYRNSPGWDNRTGGAVGFTVSAPPQVAAGSNFSVTVTAIDGLGNPVPNFLGTVDLDSGQSSSVSRNLSAQYSFTGADGGRHTFLLSNLTQTGGYTLSVVAVAMPTLTVPVTVAPASLAQFAFATPVSVPAGTPFSFTIAAEDKYGNAETGYTGTVHFSAMASDTQAVLPADYTFTAADAGSHTFSVTLFKTQGISSPFLSAMDTATGISSLAPISVAALAPNKLTMTSLPSPFAAGTLAGVNVAALDIYGNVATNYNGTVHFSSSDARAALPADYTFTAADAGRHAFTVTLKTTGTQSLAVTDNVNPTFVSAQSGIVVVPGSPSVWVLADLPTSPVAGAAQKFTLTAIDAVGNITPNFFGTVHFSSSDTQAVLPADYTFTATDAGSHTFTSTLKTAGTQSLAVTDTVNALLAATQSIVVKPAAASALVLGGFPATTAGVAHTLTVTAKDAFGNVATSYFGTVHFNSSDTQAVLPADYAFTSADAGTHDFTPTLNTGGSQTLSVVDINNPLLTASTNAAVNAAAVSTLAAVFPTRTLRSTAQTLTVSATDAFGNVSPGYTGTVAFSSSDAQAGLPAHYTFSSKDAGIHTFSVTLKTAGAQSITVQDTANATLKASLSGIMVAISNNPTALVFGAGSGAGTYGGTTTATVTLTSAGLPLANMTVGFALNGTSVGTAVTSASGVAALGGISLVGLNVGAYPSLLAATFAGNETYVSSAAAADVAVSQAVTTINSSQALTSLAVSSNSTVTIGSGGNLTVTGPVTFDSGGLLSVAQNGRLNLPAISAQPNSIGISFNSGTLRANAGFGTSVPITLGAGGGTVDTNGQNLVLAGPLSGVGGLTKSGPGILTLAGANSYTGGTIVSAGTLMVTSASALPNGTSLTVGAAAAFALASSPLIVASGTAVTTAVPATVHPAFAALAAPTPTVARVSASGSPATPTSVIAFQHPLTLQERNNTSAAPAANNRRVPGSGTAWAGTGVTAATELKTDAAPKPTVKFVPSPTAEFEEKIKVPASTTVPPLKVFVPERTSVPAPTLVSAKPVPLTGPEMSSPLVPVSIKPPPTANSMPRLIT